MVNHKFPIRLISEEAGAIILSWCLSNLLLERLAIIRFLAYEGIFSCTNKLFKILLVMAYTTQKALV